jgi:hypothetical protein
MKIDNFNTNFFQINIKFLKNNNNWNLKNKTTFFYKNLHKIFYKNKFLYIE